MITARENDSVRTMVEAESLFDGRTVPAGLEGFVVHAGDDGSVLVELALRPQTATEDGDFVQVELNAGQYEVIPDIHA
jgi:hypothetical protein